MIDYNKQTDKISFSVYDMVYPKPDFEPYLNTYFRGEKLRVIRVISTDVGYTKQFVYVMFGGKEYGFYSCALLK